MFSITNVLIYYGTQSDIRVKSDWVMHLLLVSVFNFQRLDILLNSNRHPSKQILSFEFDSSFLFLFGASQYITGLSRTSVQNLLSFEYSRSFCFQFRACRYIIGLNRKSKLKVIAVCICHEHPFSISSV